LHNIKKIYNLDLSYESEKEKDKMGMIK